MKSRKELKDEYKQLKFKIGVFQIRNKVNGKIFVSSSVNMDALWNRIKAQLKIGNHPNNALQQDWNLQCEDDFIFEVVSELNQKNEESIDYQKEVKILEEMVRETLKNALIY